MLGEREAIVLEVKPWDVHGIAYVDVTVTFPDRSIEAAWLGRESVPDELRPGDRVLVTTAANMIVSLRATT